MDRYDFISKKISLKKEKLNLPLQMSLIMLDARRLVGQRPMKSLSSVRMSVRLSVCSSVIKFSQDWIIRFF